MNHKRGFHNPGKGTFREFRQFVIEEQRFMSKEIQKQLTLNLKMFEKKQRERRKQKQEAWGLDYSEEEFQSEPKSRRSLHPGKNAKNAKKQESSKKSANGGGAIIRWKNFKKKKSR